MVSRLAARAFFYCNCKLKRKRKSPPVDPLVLEQSTLQYSYVAPTSAFAFLLVGLSVDPSELIVSTRDGRKAVSRLALPDNGHADDPPNVNPRLEPLTPSPTRSFAMWSRLGG